MIIRGEGVRSGEMAMRGVDPPSVWHEQAENKTIEWGKGLT